MKTSQAWEHFRHSNIVSTSASSTQVGIGEGGDSDGAEEDGFVGSTKNGSQQEMMMQIMDKYVQAGEALAWKENEVLDLTKQVQEVRAVNGDLETRVSQLTTSNEKLMDSEGRWYSLARELENQMDVIKKGETYSLFQDKVDEAEARLEVATDANNTCRKRLFEVYGVVRADFKNDNNDGGDEDVDEHRLHATILEQLQHLKSATMDIEDALAASRDATSAAEQARQQAQAQEAELRIQLDVRVSKLREEAAELREEAAELREEAAARDAAAQAEQVSLRDAFARQAQELAEALEGASHSREACTAAEATAQAAEDARRAAVGVASTAESNLEDVREDLRLAKLKIQSFEGQLSEACAALEASQQEATRRHEEQDVAESSTRQLSNRVVELEKLLQDAQVRSSEVESDLADSSHHVAELTQAIQVSQREVAEATTKSDELQAYVDTQDGRLRESLERVTELSDTLQTLRLQLNEKDNAISVAQSEAERALQGASASTEHAERLRQELDRVTAEASATTQEYAAQVAGLREELERISADTSAAGDLAAQVQELRRELELVTDGATSAAQQSATNIEGLRQELASTSAAATSAAQESATLTESLRQELESANAALLLAEQNAACTERLRQELESLRQELESTNTALLLAEQNAACTERLRQELESLTLALSGAEDGIARSDEARLAAEAQRERAEGARADAEEQLETVRERLASSEAHAESHGIGAFRAEGDDFLLSAQQAAAIATQALAEAREDVLQAETRSASAELAREESRQQVAKLEDHMRGLERQLSEAKACSTALEGRVAAIQAELDERTVALTRAEEASAAMAAVAAVPGMAASVMPPPPPLSGAETSDVCADVLFGSPAPDYSPSTSTGGREASAAVANGVASAPRSAEAEQLQAHAEAMELELRYTLESFEGQLSAMAREKVAIQKQVKELTGQCTTLRKQVSHYKKMAKESEAQVEQMLELQQQLCDAESAAESLRDANRDLTSKLEVLRADSSNETHETMWRQSQDEVIELRARLADSQENIAAKSQELAAKEQEATSARALASTLEQQMQEANSEILALREVSQSTAEELTSALASASELRCSVSKMAELETVVDDLEAEKHQLEDTVETLSSELGELQQVVRSMKEEKARVLQSDEVIELRARLADSQENIAAKSQELAAKEQEATSARTLASTLEQQMQEANSEILALREVSQSTAEELTSALASASELRCSVSKMAELETVVDDLEAEKHQLEETVATLSSELRELQQVVRSMEEEKARVLQSVQQAEEGRSMLAVQLRDIANLIGCERSDEGAAVSSLGITDKIALLKTRLTAAEDLLEATALGLQKTAIEGEVGLESELSWIINSVSSLQRRLHMAESELSQRPKIQDVPILGETTMVLKDLSMALECDESRVRHKVHELKKLAHELFEIRDSHVKEIQQLKEDAKTGAPTQMVPGGDVAAAREQTTVLQGKIDALTNELFEAHQLREEDAEKHRREEARLQERHEALIRFTKERANGGGSKQPCLNDKRPSLHRKCSSLQLRTSSTGGWLSELAERGIGAKIDGEAISWDSAPSGSTRVASHSMKREAEANGSAYAVDSSTVTRGIDAAVAESAAFQASKPVALLANVQALLGCTTEEVMGVLSEQQAASKLQQLTTKILGDVRHSYLNNMDSLASAIGQEVAGKVAPLLAQASELGSKGACLTSTQEGLEVLDEATSILTSSLRESTAAIPEMAKVAQRQAGEEVAALNETLRKERLMMMAFRRWGHFYLALSNDALRKRTQEQNQARSQRDTPETVSLSIMEQPRNGRGRSRRSSSAGRRGSGRQPRLQLSSSDVQAMVEQEAESVARELADEPSLSLLALADARKEMDDIAMKAQATLGVLYAQPPLAQDDNAATDRTMVVGVVEPVSEGKKMKEGIEDLPSPGGSANARVDVSLNGANVAVGVDARGVGDVAGDTPLAPPPALVSIDEQQRQDEAGDIQDLTEVPETEDPGPGSVNGAPNPPPPTSLSTSSSLTPPPMGLASKLNGTQGSTGAAPGRGGGPGIASTLNAPPGRTTGPLVEDGISKKDRQEYLKKQREERKANRKNSRPRSVEPSGSVGIRNRRTSAPAVMPSTVNGPSGFTAPGTPATPPRQAPGNSNSKADFGQEPPIATVEDNAEAESSATGDQVVGAAVPPIALVDSSAEGLAPPAAAIRPPPTFFNPTAVPPPVAPPSTAASSHAQPPRHPSIAFNVNETVEKALTKARRDAGVAERSAAFWKSRFRDLAMWSASFVVLAYASDHGFEDC